jgi:hypothetical protein
VAKRKPPPPNDDSPDPSDDERIKFPFGETGSDSAAWNDGSGSEEGPFDASASDLSQDSAPFDASGSDSGEFDDLSGDEDLLEDSDLEGIESRSGLDPFGSAASLSSGNRIPTLPPDADPSDDASLDGFGYDASSEESLVDLQDSGQIQGITDFGPISPSGPLVIVDDDGASTRFQASIVDDSARLAGAESARAPKRRPKRSTRQSWQEEEVDPDEESVPTLSTRRPAEKAAPGKKGGWIPWLVALLLALLVGGVQEVRRQSDLEDQAKRLEAERQQALEAARLEAEAAKEKELQAERQRGAAAAVAAKQAADRAVASAREAGAADGRREGEREGRRKAERAFEGRLAKAKAEGRAAGEAASKQAVAAELASARREAEAKARRELEGALQDAVAAERKRGADSTKEALASADRRHERELRRLRDELKAELAAGGSSREEDQELAAALERDRKEALNESEGGGGGSEVDDWEADLFGDSTPRGGSGGSGGGSSGSGGADTDDLEALFADDGGSGEEGGMFEEEGENLHPVDRAWAWARENIHGKAGYKNLTHFDRGASDARTTRHEFRAELSYRDWLWQNEVGSGGVRVVAELQVQADDDTYATGIPDSLDDDDRRRPILTTGDFYIALAIDWFEVRAGYQIFSWGTGDLLNPTNNINPIDFSDAFDSRRIPVMAAAITLDFDFISLEAVAVPTFTRSRLPLRNRRFDALRNSALPVLNPEDPEEEPENAQVAARAIAHVGGIDLSISGYRGFSDLPSARLVVIQQPIQALVVDPVYERIHVAGFDFATTLGIFGIEGGLGEFLGGIQVHGEAAHVFNESKFGDDFLQYVVGINYQFVDLIFEHDLTLVLEYASEYVTKDAEGTQANGNALDRVFRSSILARLAYEVNESISFEVNGALVLHGDENAYVHPAAKWNVTDNLQLELAGDIFWGAEGTFFGQFDKDTRVIFEARVVF